MRLCAPREQLLPVLQQVIGVVERRQTLPILGHLLFDAGEMLLTVTTTDLEVELQASAELPAEVAGRLTLPARKLLDIVRSLPEGAQVELSRDGGQAQLRSRRSRFSLSPLAAEDFPALEEIEFDSQVRLPSSALHELLTRTHFAMAQQDVRYYLNGLLLETSARGLTAVATDGHRLALCDLPVAAAEAFGSQVIVPRKGVQELLRLLGGNHQEVVVQLASNHLRVAAPWLRFTCRLIDGRFPDYARVIPPESEQPVVADRLLLRDALARAAILSNEKYRGVRLRIAPGQLAVLAQNPENEAAEEELEVDYQGAEVEMGFNVSYLLDALGAIGGDLVHLSLFDASTSCLISDADDKRCRYVVMPMRL
jgi:DNA polymerase-3 subunit beta